MEPTTLDYVFERPEQWGLRGDKGLWYELKKRFEKESPASAEIFEQRLHLLFRELTGADVQRGQWIHVARYDEGGMSKGLVCGEFWLDKGLPLLLNRFKAVMR